MPYKLSLTFGSVTYSFLFMISLRSKPSVRLRKLKKSAAWSLKRTTFGNLMLRESYMILREKRNVTRDIKPYLSSIWLRKERSKDLRWVNMKRLNLNMRKTQ
jgi:hypothetical protein